MKTAIKLAEMGWLPDIVIRLGIRRLLEERLREIQKGTTAPEVVKQKLIAELRHSPIAMEVDAANRQHYEVPAELFVKMLGPHLKYSSAYWPAGVTSLALAEEAMLALTCERARIRDGMQILELGCGWGSLCLWIAENYPDCSILAVSNSRSQREYIEACARDRNLRNLKVVTADINQFDPALHGRQPGSFDRVVSVEMFEHLRNYEEMFARIRRWLTAEGKLFLHVFCHRDYAYAFEDHGDGDWMARYFFTGGLMPSDDLFGYFARDLRVERQWRISGVHYQKTLLAWLVRFDENRAAVHEIMAATYGQREASIWLYRWRIFLLACAELFGYRGGVEWGVGHYLLAPIP